MRPTMKSFCIKIKARNITLWNSHIFMDRMIDHIPFDNIPFDWAYSLLYAYYWEFKYGCILL